jgi:hypothetical protein
MSMSSVKRVSAGQSTAAVNHEYRYTDTRSGTGLCFVHAMTLIKISTQSGVETDLTLAVTELIHCVFEPRLGTAFQ